MTRNVTLTDVQLVSHTLAHSDERTRLYAGWTFDYAMSATSRKTIENMRSWATPEWKYLHALVRIALRTFDAAATPDADPADLTWI